MKIAVISDIHGNHHALSAVLDDIQRQKPDLTICLGDIVDWSPGSKKAWEIMQASGIPTVKGNKEWYLLEMHNPNGNELYRSSPRFHEMRMTAKHFTRDELDVMQNLPLNIIIEGPRDHNICFCHGTPNDFTPSISDYEEDQIAEMFTEFKVDLVVAGHYHKRWYRQWKDKQLILTPSVGLPMQLKPEEAEYMLLTHQNGSWQHDYRIVQYDHAAAFAEILESDIARECGPLGWMLIDCFGMQINHLVPFLHDYCGGNPPDDYEPLKEKVIGYLQSVGRWEAVKGYLGL